MIAEQLEQAGFVDYEVDRVDFAYEFPSAEAWWATTKGLSGVLAEATAGLDAATEAEIVDALRRTAEPWTQPDGTLRIPARTWVAAATG